MYKDICHDWVAVQPNMAKEYYFTYCPADDKVCTDRCQEMSIMISCTQKQQGEQL